MCGAAGPGFVRKRSAATGRLLDDFAFAEGPRALHLLNAPSPAATAALAIGAHLAERVTPWFGER
jgi:(S)-2-hydroxyglutarate dehydrogenase